jgi:menaquinone-specific isochorismate synthase
MATRLVSYSQPAPDLDPADFLRQAQGQERFYWQHNDKVYAGFGIAAEFTAWGEDRFQSIREKAADLFRDLVLLNEDDCAARPRLFGGFSFRSDFVTENTWAAFAPAYFVLPHYQLTQISGESWLTINVQLGDGDDLDAEAIRAALEARYNALFSPIPEFGEGKLTRSWSAGVGSNALTSITYPMSFDAWADIITDATDRMKSGELEKVVLSRVCELRFADRVNIDNALDYLRAKYAGCYLFLFEPSPHLAFYGATPELLVQVEGREIETMALAGSIKRGLTPADDDALAYELLDDPKNRHEHALVADELRKRLTPLTDALDISDTPQILRLSNIQHLCTPVHGQLKSATGVLPLVEALHPTPAMGGVPQAQAMDYIAAAEPVPRGWYASPIGWIDANLDGAFAVAIRSAISQNERVWLYAGAGIVTDSDPQKEWDETALKFKPMLDALGAQANVHA